MKTELYKLLKAFEKGQEGISIVIKSLNSNKKEIREFAYWLLKDIENPNLEIQQALKKFYPYPHFKYLYNLQQDSGFFLNIALSPNNLILRDIETWSEIITLENTDYTHCLKFNADGTILFTGQDYPNYEIQA